MFLCALCLYPATPGWGVMCGCVCLGSGSGCAPPLLAGVLGSVCVCVRAPLVPRHPWLGCAVWVGVIGLGFGLRPAAPGRDVGMCVCLCACSACTRLILAGVRGVGVCAWPRFRLRPATPGRGVRVSVCFGARSASTPPLLAGVYGVGVCAWARVLAVPGHSWLGCWGVCVFVCVLRLYPAYPGWSPRCGSVRLASVSAAPRHSWPGCSGLCVFWCALRVYPATPGWGVRCGCVCLGSGFGCDRQLLAGVLVCVCLCARSACTPPLLAGMCGVGVCAWARVSAAPRHSWMGCWGLCVSVCVCVRSACTPLLLAGVRGVGVCAWAQVSAAAPPLLAGVRGIWVGCRLAPVPVPWFVLGCARCPDLRQPVAVVAWHPSVSLSSGRRRASMACLVAPCWCAAPQLVRSLSVLWSAFPTPW